MSTSPVLMCALFLFLSEAMVHGSMEILQPRRTSLWIANGKTRKVLFSYDGKELDNWVVTLHDLQGKMIHSYPADILFPEKRGGKIIFKKQAVVPEELESGVYTVEVCGFAQEERKLCKKSEAFQVEGHQRKYNSEDKLEPHEKRYQAHIDALEDHLRKLDVQDVWPVNETHCTIPRIHRPTKDEFIDKCMRPAQACIVSGMMDQWKAMNKWRFEVFQHDPRIDEGFLVGQRTQSVPLSSYVWYLKERAMNDISPWSIFMSEVFDFYPVLREDYTVPDIFSESDDFLTGVDESLRLDWRWIIMAAKRSGSGWHVDPANTTGWLALIQGAKLWGMYPPSVGHVPGVKTNFYQRRDYEAEDAFYWWIYTRPYLKSNLPIECVQKPGDIVYIPSGWWHSVLNLENTVSVTQNFCNKYSLRICLTELREQADSDGGFIGRTFEQLRELYSRDYPQYFEEQDFEFEAPMEGDGLTEAEETSRKLQNLKDFFFGKSASIE